MKKGMIPNKWILLLWEQSCSLFFFPSFYKKSLGLQPSKFLNHTSNHTIHYV